MITREAPDQSTGMLLAGRYRLGPLVGRGGMSRVYVAHDHRLHRQVAVKVLAPPYADDEHFVLRFSDEARAAAAVSHPNLVHVYDAGTDAGQRFIVMELLAEARSLRQELAVRGKLPPDEAVSLVIEVLAGLEALHRTDRVHCDVKPANVMLDEPGVKLIDLGIARPLHAVETASTSIGSLQAMAPEQLAGEELTPATDVFAVGVMLYEMLTGELPYPGRTPDELRAAHARGPEASAAELEPAVGPRLSDAVAQALRSEPRSRFASAAAMRNALAQAQASDLSERQPQRAAEETTLPRAPASPPSRLTHPAVVTLLAVLATVLLAGAALAGAAVLRRDDHHSVTSVPAVGGALATSSPRPTPGSTAAAASAPSPTPTPTLSPAASNGAGPAGTVAVPATVGLSEAQGEAAANQAGLNWRLEWQVAPAKSPGIYAQEPAAGTAVQSGSAFVMYAYRAR